MVPGRLDFDHARHHNVAQFGMIAEVWHGGGVDPYPPAAIRYLPRGRERLCAHLRRLLVLGDPRQQELRQRHRVTSPSVRATSLASSRLNDTSPRCATSTEYRSEPPS